MAYCQWKTRLSRALSDLEIWLESQGQATPESRGRIRYTLDALSRDRLTVAFVGKPSHGKTELINAVFLEDPSRRLFPRVAGRPRTCPVELLWDQDCSDAYLRLLPIETRARDIPIDRLKKNPTQWTQFSLRLQEPAQMASVLQKMLETANPHTGLAGEEKADEIPNRFGLQILLQHHGGDIA